LSKWRPHAATTFITQKYAPKLCSCAVLLLCQAGLMAAAQQNTYEQINGVDLLVGYVGNGRRIETAGHFWLNADQAFFNVN
jgi:hypothetical protein